MLMLLMRATVVWLSKKKDLMKFGSQNSVSSRCFWPISAGFQFAHGAPCSSPWLAGFHGFEAKAEFGRRALSPWARTRRLRAG
jgi:hypothetical protein